MQQYNIEFSEIAIEDINQLHYVIEFQYKSPLTAFRYGQGLINEIKKLRYTADALPLQTRKSLTRYANNVRRLNYKRIAIIYSISAGTVYILRVIPANAIAGL